MRNPYPTWLFISLSIIIAVLGLFSLSGKFSVAETTEPGGSSISCSSPDALSTIPCGELADPNDPSCGVGFYCAKNVETCEETATGLQCVPNNKRICDLCDNTCWAASKSCEERCKTGCTTSRFCVYYCTLVLNACLDSCDIGC